MGEESLGPPGQACELLYGGRCRFRLASWSIQVAVMYQGPARPHEATIVAKSNRTPVLACNAPFPFANFYKTKSRLLSTTEPPSIREDHFFGQGRYESRQYLARLGEERVRLAEEGHNIWQQIVSAPTVCGMGIEEHTAVEREAEKRRG